MDSIKYEIKKYLGRERRKKLPEDVPYWAFDCKIGETVEEAVEIRVRDINPKISELYAAGNESFYMEILAKPGRKKETTE